MTIEHADNSQIVQRLLSDPCFFLKEGQQRPIFRGRWEYDEEVDYERLTRLQPASWVVANRWECDLGLLFQNSTDDCG